jgi:hypothetical protein
VSDMRFVQRPSDGGAVVLLSARGPDQYGQAIRFARFDLAMIDDEVATKT